MIIATKELANLLHILMDEKKNFAQKYNILYIIEVSATICCSTSLNENSS